eukprot:CAMPEP_0177384606 /NCGR_PEP_ID=MMETSP0368-20130122/49792_1 /TAXON_ID=447022 ORGANISM="Scrippsiella hangoei-like, Strain SHHI-4" /NCGR_SAMPLE_ID=MMETSP0368 /ASSEMBLY_ACC=CAM_ASM_000363 /LENGTH=41 /DNA_ID= /DNA_START= /DNA_END= /DNA_ORIENTATION=
MILKSGRARCACGKHPGFGMPEDARAGYCSSCKSIDMVDLV